MLLFASVPPWKPKGHAKYNLTWQRAASLPQYAQVPPPKERAVQLETALTENIRLVSQPKANNWVQILLFHLLIW